MLAASHGLGEHIQNVPKQNLVYLVRLQVGLAQTFLFGISCVKISLILTILRFVRKKSLRILLYVLIAFVCAIGLSATIHNYLRCRPFRAVWDFSYPRSACESLASREKWLYGFTSMSASIFEARMTYQDV